MAQHKLEQSYKHRKVILNSSLPPRENKKKMTSTTIPRSPHRSSNPNADQKDRQQQHSDTASVASTVKISNVATPSPLPKTIHGDNRTIPTSIRPSTITTGSKSIDESRDDNQNRGIDQRQYNQSNGYQRDLLIAHTNSNTTTDHAAIVTTELFLLRSLESLSPNDYLRIITDRMNIPHNLQIRLAGDRSQPFTITRLRLIWNDLTSHDYQCISNSFFQNMQFSEKRTFPFSLKRMKRFFSGCRIPPHRCTRKTQDHPSLSKDSTVPSSDVPYPVSHLPTTTSAEEQVNNNYEGYVDVSASTIMSSSSQPTEAVEMETKPAPPVSNISHILSTPTITVAQADERHSSDVASNTIPSTLQQQQQQQQDPILMLLEIADSVSVNSSSTNGYATSMTSSIGSSSNMSRNNRYYNNNNRYQQNHHFPSNPRPNNNNNNNNGTVTTANHGNTNTVTPPPTTGTTTASWMSSNNNGNTSQSSNNQYKQQQQQQYHHHSDMDNDSTTSSNTGYISTMSNSHISISGSVASV